MVGSTELPSEVGKKEEAPWPYNRPWAARIRKRISLRTFDLGRSIQTGDIGLDLCGSRVCAFSSEKGVSVVAEADPSFYSSWKEPLTRISPWGSE